MAHQQLTYGTLVMLGLSVVGLTIYHTGGANRNRIIPADIIELVEGTRERELIVSTITKTNFIGMHIATNRVNLIELDGAILALIPSFVNYPAVPEWLASWDGESDPPMWTVEELFAYLSIGDHTNRFTRTPSIGTNAATYGEYPAQIYKTDLAERFLVLRELRFTWGPTQWGSNAVCGDAGTVPYSSDSFSTNFISPSADNSWTYCTNAPDVWDDVIANLPGAVDLAGDFSAYFTVGFCDSYEPVLHGIRPYLTQSAEMEFYLNLNIGGNSANGVMYPYQNNRVYLYTNSIAVNYAYSNVSARIEGFGPGNLPILRKDYYYYVDWSTGEYDLFQVVSVSSNVTMSTTSIFAEPPQSELNASLFGQYDVGDDYTANCFGQFGQLLYGVGLAFTTNIIVTESRSTNAPALPPCIHEWRVTRCRYEEQ
jgi:hypothetical protein